MTVRGPRSAAGLLRLARKLPVEAKIQPIMAIRPIMGAMRTAKPQEIIRKMVRRIVRKFKPDQVVLFGSYARGTAGPDSDVDLLVVMPVMGSKTDKLIEIRVALSGMGLSKDIVVATPEDVKKYRDIIGTTLYPAFREGKILYERTA